MKIKDEKPKFGKEHEENVINANNKVVLWGLEKNAQV